MADTFVKKPMVVVGTKDQVVAEMGANNFGIATDVSFYTAEETDAKLADKQDTTTAINYDNITNCITEIPQDIKLELIKETLYAWENTVDSSELYTKTETPQIGDYCYGSAGTVMGEIVDVVSYGSEIRFVYDDREWERNVPADTTLNQLVLKAGSKTYLPNGDGVFDVLTTQSDQTYNFGSTTGQFLLFVKNNDHDYFTPNVCTSGPTDSLSGQSWHVWYDTTNNSVKVYTDNGSTPARTRCLPIALITIDSGSVIRIDQVFNGFGYIGSTKYVLPGVKGLIPNKKNPDESLKNKEFTTSSVMIFTGASTNFVIGFFNGNDLTNYNASSIVYNKELNRNINTVTGAEVDMIPYTNIYTQTAGKINYCTFKKPFHAVDYNNTEFIAHQAKPSDRFVDMLSMLPAASGYVKAPADGYFVCAISGGYVELQNPITEISSSANVASGGWGRAFLPVSKGQQIIINYGNNTTFQHFRFVYANGAQ